MNEPLRIISPADGSLHHDGAYSSDSAVAHAIESARAAVAAWRETTIADRISVLDRFVDMFVAEADALALMTAWQIGRPLAKADETGDLRFIYDYYKSTIESVSGRISLPLDPGETRFAERVPYGINLSICAWNYPVVMLSSLVLAPLLAGNVVIFKHSPQTAPIGEQVNRAAKAAGLPVGVLTALDMTNDQSARLLGSGDIALVSFVGSVRGGLEVRRAASSAFVHQILELGGKDAAYVRADADLDAAADELVRASFTNSGQSCCSVERIYVDRQIHDRFVDRFVDAARQWTLGHPVLESAALGPVVNAAAARRIEDEIADAVAAGARDVLRATLPGLPGGAYVAPRVLTGVTQDMAIMQTETFGPVAPIMPVASDDEAISLMNDSRYGLTGSIWTRDIERGLSLGRRVDVGNFYVNQADYVDIHLPWGGTRASGVGRTDGFSWFESLTKTRGYYARQTLAAESAEEGAHR
jgi:acyl-CoA reductase-like NAD-dependent aldehyde dehydrogenase